jgi:hypothetical protein
MSTHESTGYSPFELVYGRKPVHPFHIHLDIGKEKHDTVQSYGLKLANNLKAMYDEVRKMQVKMALINKENNSGKYKPAKYDKNDYVLYYNPKKIKDPASTGSYKPQKLCWRWTEPMKITKKIDDWTYEISDGKNTLEAPVNRLRIYSPWSDGCLDTSPWLKQQEKEILKHEGLNEIVDEDDGVSYDSIPQNGIPVGSLLVIPTTFDLQPFAVGKLIQRSVSKRDGRTKLVVQWYYNNKRNPAGKFLPGWRYKERGQWFENYSVTQPRYSAIECKNDFEHDIVEIDEATVCWHGFDLVKHKLPPSLMSKIKDSCHIDYQ